jgi:S1-C subfamily serine protease
MMKTVFFRSHSSANRYKMKSASRLSKSLTILIALMFLLLDARNTAAQIEHPGKGGPAAMGSVFKIVCPIADSQGTAFGHRSGKIITARHVIAKCSTSEIQIVNADGATTSVTNVVGDQSVDLALLTPSVRDFVKTPFEITSKETVGIGEQAVTWGFPAGYSGKPPLLSVGIIAGIDNILVNPEATTTKRALVINGTINKGNSGGFVLETRTATIVGVVMQKLVPSTIDVERTLNDLDKDGTAKEKDLAKLFRHLQSQTQLVIGYAVFYSDLREFLKKNNIEP